MTESSSTLGTYLSTLGLNPKQMRHKADLLLLRLLKETLRVDEVFNATRAFGDPLRNLSQAVAVFGVGGDDEAKLFRAMRSEFNQVLSSITFPNPPRKKPRRSRRVLI